MEKRKSMNSILRVLSLMLCAVMLLGCLTGCGDLDEKGAVVNIYLGAEMRSWDPAIGFTDAAAVKYFSLVSEGLMTYDKKGKVVPCGSKNFDEKTNSSGDKVLTFDIIGSWSDGRPVSANDYVYSFKRILDPDFSSPAKALLYPIKNAGAIMEGKATIDELCLYAPKTKTLEIVLENPDYDTEAFLENLCSMALVPVREDMVAVYDVWDSTAIDLLTNGPFNIKTMDSDKEGGQLILERNNHYHEISHNIFLSDEVKYKYITPYRLVVNYGLKYEDREAAYDYDFSDGEVKTESGTTFSKGTDQLMYLSGLNGDSELSKIKTDDLMSTYCYYFNTENKLFQKKEVRQALSMALDREKLAALYYGASPATGLVPNGVNYSSRKNTFRDEAGDVLSVTGDLDGAKKLMKSAGVSGGSFTLTYRDVNRNGEIAALVKEAWDSLGFKVKLQGLDYTDYMSKMNLYVEGVTNLVREVTKDDDGKDIVTYYLVDEDGNREETEYVEDYSLKSIEDEPESYYDFDVIGLDFQALTANAFYSLALFSPKYSGNAVMTQYGDFEPRTHMTGYLNSDFNDLIEQAAAAADREAAAAILINAEKTLLDDMPVCPVIFNAESHVSSSKLSKEKFVNSYGIMNFSKMKLKNFADYAPQDEENIAVSTAAD